MKSFSSKSEANSYCHEVVIRWLKIYNKEFASRDHLRHILASLDERLAVKYRTSWHFDVFASSRYVLVDCDGCGMPRLNAVETTIPMIPNAPKMCAQCLVNPPEKAEEPEPLIRTEDMTTLYRYFDSKDKLLYIGISGKPGKRLHEHYKNQPWSGLIARSEFVHYEGRDEALAAEASAIKSEKPKYNVVHNR